MVNSPRAVERHLFVAGCPRSGTSAVAFLLNEHPRVALGFERFKRVRGVLDPFHFTPAQFFAPVLAETDIRGELLYERLHARWRGGTVTTIGDKVPLYTRVLPQLLARFSDARVVVLVREPVDVAVSFRRRARDPRDWWPVENDHRLAVKMWNEALDSVRAADQGDPSGAGRAEERVLLLPYEPLLAGDERWLAALLAFVGLPLTARLSSEHRRLAERWNARVEEPAEADVASFVEHHRDAELAGWARERMDEQLARAPAPPPLDPGEDEPPLSAAELAEREREHRQLLEEMRQPGRHAVGEIDVLEARVVDQMKELVRRGDRPSVPRPAPASQSAPASRPAPASQSAPASSSAPASQSALATQSAPASPSPSQAAPAAPPPTGSDRPRVTFILPHQRPTTGGVYVIEQFARHIAPHMTPVLVVRDRRTRPVPPAAPGAAGVEVRSAPQLDPAELPEADVLVYPADMADAAGLAELPAAAGRPVMLFQGYGTPGSPVVTANLATARACVAVARWLVADAVEHGAPCTYVPEGLDRELFAPGPPASERPARVTAMTHRLDWKGLEDALAALALVRAARPDVEVVLFGAEPVAGVGTFHASPSRAEVAELLRSSAVHVVASWEEGFGLTGAEAIACGAALASTDTKGSRDYALPERTALVSPPRDPRALADNVLALLGDGGLRERLVTTGQRHLRGVMPPWPEAARRMALALIDEL